MREQRLQPSPETVQQEKAARIAASVKPDQVKDDSQADIQIKHEKSELTPILVSVEQLIPDIKLKGSSKLTQQEEFQSGRDRGDVYARGLARKINRALPHEKINRFFEGQIVVDLGAGSGHGYATSMVGKARGYIGVDKFEDLSKKFIDPIKVRESVVDEYHTLVASQALIPVSTVVEDMLSFLRRLPDNSVSIISSGHFDLIQNRKYIEEVEKEMTRVLSPTGLLIVNDGITIKDRTNTDALNTANSDLEIIAKKKEKE